jgi:hypothetical protein
MNIETLGGRKFLLSNVALLSVVVLGALKPDALTTELVGAIVGILGAYSASNVLTSKYTTASPKDVIVSLKDTIGPLKDTTEEPETYITEDQLKTEIMAVEASLLSKVAELKDLQDLQSKTLNAIGQRVVGMGKQ